MACKNNKKNKRRAAFYRISKFDYEVREKLVEEQPSLKKTDTKEKAEIVKYGSDYQWAEI